MAILLEKRGDKEARYITGIDLGPGSAVELEIEKIFRALGKKGRVANLADLLGKG